MDYLGSTSKMDDRQHGSRAGWGCLTQLLAQYDDILDKLQDKYNVDQICLDFEKAFWQNRPWDPPTQTVDSPH